MKADALAAQLAALPGAKTEDLWRHWRRLFRSEPPHRMKRDLLILAIAWKLQEKALGGLTAAQKRRLAALADNPEKSAVAPEPSVRLRPSLKLVRAWRGVTHTVTVLEDGFDWNGQRRSSLSAIAREITGAKWSGPRFFGVKTQRARARFGRDG